MKKLLTLLVITAMLCASVITANASDEITVQEVRTTMQREIPENAFLYKEGLYIVESEVTVGTIHYTKWELYSAPGWCFYDLQIPENFDEEGNLRPPMERMYAQYRIMRKDEAYVDDYIVCVPVEEGFEIVSAGNTSVM